MLENALLLTIAIIVAARLFQPRLRQLRDWRATVTPLASIISSGFLVAKRLWALAQGAEARSIVERRSGLVLALAYVISVAFYLRLLASLVSNAVCNTRWSIAKLERQHHD